MNLEEWLRRASQPTVESLEAAAAGKSPRVREMLSEIAEHFSDPRYSVLQLREKVGATKHMMTEFRNEVGRTPWSVVRECRMEAALRLLRDSLLSVEDIAFLVGYEAVRPFNRLCRAWCGISPSRLRDLLRRIRQELGELPEEVFSWSFWDRYERGKLAPERLDEVIEFLRKIHGVSKEQVEP